MIKLILIAVIVIIVGCQSNYSDEILVRGFTHSDSEILDVYEPSGGKVLKSIGPDEEAGWIVNIIGKQDNYFLINIKDLSLDSIFVLKGTISLNTRNYDGQQIELYKLSDKHSEIVAYLNGEQTVKILDVCKEWAYVEGKRANGKNVKGWLEPDMQCGNPYTTCP